MNIQLFIGDRNYSSWSLRGWLAAEISGLEYQLQFRPMKTDAFAQMQKDNFPARTVPLLTLSENDSTTPIWDSVAVVETLYELAPNSALFPADRRDRATARSLIAEMHAGFMALRSVCNMDMRTAYIGFEVDEAVKADVARIEALWRWAMARHAGNSPWLMGGEFSAVDAFYAPVASRFATYALGENAQTHAYVYAVLAALPIRQWRAMGEAENRVLAHYKQPHEQGPRPGVAVMPAQAVDASRQPENTFCPFSGKPVAEDSMAVFKTAQEDRIIGFCNQFCRDKAVADPLAWPSLATLID